MKQLIRSAALVVAALALSACAVSPQQIEVTPESSASFASAASSDIRINLQVRDTRDSMVLGTLGGTYGDSSTLSASNNVAQDIRDVLQSKLIEAGYVVGAEDSDFRMDVSIQTLSYELADQGLGSEVRTSAELAVRVEDNDGFLTRSFRSGSNQSRVTRPTAGDNRMFLQEALNDSLSRLISDQQLNQFLAR